MGMAMRPCAAGVRAAAVVGWFRGLQRGYKFAILLVEAWAPFVLPRNPVITGVLMQIATVVFFISTGQNVSEVRTARCHLFCLHGL